MQCLNFIVTIKSKCKVLKYFIIKNLRFYFKDIERILIKVQNNHTAELIQINHQEVI